MSRLCPPECQAESLGSHITKPEGSRGRIDPTDLFCSLLVRRQRQTAEAEGSSAFRPAADLIAAGLMSLVKTFVTVFFLSPFSIASMP